MTARRADDINGSPDITVVTPERAPAGGFGDQRARPDGPPAGSGNRHHQLRFRPIPDGRPCRDPPGWAQLQADRVVALPQLFGPARAGPARRRARVHPRRPRWPGRAARPLCTPPVMRPTSRSSTAVSPPSRPIQSRRRSPPSPARRGGHARRPEIRGMLLTGGKPLYLSARITPARIQFTDHRSAHLVAARQDRRPIPRAVS